MAFAAKAQRAEGQFRRLEVNTKQTKVSKISILKA